MTGRYEVRATVRGLTTDEGTSVLAVIERTDDRERAKAEAARNAGWVLDTQTGQVFAPSIHAWIRREDAEGTGIRRLLAAVLATETTGSPLWRSPK